MSRASGEKRRSRLWPSRSVGALGRPPQFVMIRRTSSRLRSRSLAPRFSLRRWSSSGGRAWSQRSVSATAPSGDRPCSRRSGSGAPSPTRAASPRCSSLVSGPRETSSFGGPNTDAAEAAGLPWPAPSAGVVIDRGDHRLLAPRRGSPHTPLSDAQRSFFAPEDRLAAAPATNVDPKSGQHG